MQPTRTEDSLFDGRLVCLQHAEGYRFSVDAVLLAHFIRPRSKETILDLGAGCGVVSLILCYRHAGVALTALELQEKLSALIEENIRANHFQDRISLVTGDLRQISSLVPAESYDWVVCNPPYGKVSSGRQNAGSEQAAARHEIYAALDDVVAAVFFALRNRSRAALIYPADRAAALLSTLKERKLEPKRLQLVHSYPGGEGKLVLVEVVKNGGEGLLVLPPFYIYQKPGGAYSAEMSRLYEVDLVKDI